MVSAGSKRWICETPLGNLNWIRATELKKKIKYESQICKPVPVGAKIKELQLPFYYRKLPKLCKQGQKDQPHANSINYDKILHVGRDCCPKFAADKWPFYDYIFLVIFWQLHQHLSQKWGSSSHFEMVNRPKS